MRIVPSIIAVLVFGCAAWVVAGDEEGHIARAKEAEQSFHRACDAWAAAKAAGQPTTQPAADIAHSYFAFMQHILKTHYIPTAAIIVPDEIVSAGAMKDGEHEMSYLAGGGHSGVFMSSFQRTAWTNDRLPGHGFLCSLGIAPPELRKSFKVTDGEWTDGEKRVLRLHYVLDGHAGVIEARRSKDRWIMRPDRGVVTSGNWWHPYPGAPTTQPVK